MNSEVVFTSAALLEFLLNVEELSEHSIGVSETLDGNIQVSIGDSVYVIDCSDVEEVPVSDEAVEVVADINDQAYEDLLGEEDMQPTDIEEIEGGILKELAKTLAVGGLARLSGKAVKEWM